MSLTRGGLLLADALWPGEFPPRDVHVRTGALAEAALDHRRLIASYAYASRGEDLVTRDSLRDLIRDRIREHVAALPPSLEGKAWSVEFTTERREATVILTDGLRVVLADDL